MELKAPIESLHQNRVQNFAAQPEQARPEKEKVLVEAEDLKKLSEAKAAVQIHEQLEKQAQEEKKNFSLNFYDSLKWFVTRVGPMATALSHSYSAINDCRFFKNFESAARKRVDDFSLLLSKVALTSSCVVNGFEAFRKNRLWEGISRIIEPLFILAENRVEDLGLARGIGLGISQLAEAQGGIYTEILKQRQGLPEDEKHIKARTMGEDHDVNATAFTKLAKEIFTDGVGKGRRFLTGFNMENIKAKLGAFVREFNPIAIKELFNASHGDITKRYVKFLESSGLIHIQKLCEGDKDKDKGHTTALSGYIMVLGSILGYIDKGSKGIMYKLGGTLRNLGGMVADISIFGHPDPYFNVAALFLSVNTFMDVVQRFIPPSMRWLITPWSNVSMASYNIGVGIYLNRSDMKSNQEEKIKNYDTDLALQAA